MDLDWDEPPPTIKLEASIEPDESGSRSREVAPSSASTKSEPSVCPRVLRPMSGSICIKGMKLFPREAKHLLLCTRGAGKCGLCAYLRLGHRWCKRTYMIRGDASSSWLGSSWLGSAWQGIGCIVCHEAKQDSAYGRMEVKSIFKTRISNLLKHQRGRAHKAAVATKIGGPVVPVPLKAPPAKVWHEALNHIRKGGALDAPCEGVGRRWKLTRMQFCLAEAMRRKDRGAIAQAVSAALYQDASGRRLVMRFSVSNHRGKVTKGIVGIANHIRAGSGSTGLALTTKELLKHFCTDLAGAPLRKGFQRPTPQPNTLLLKHFRLIVEIFGTDAASDEVAAVRSLGPLGSRSMLYDEEAYFPNQLILARDFTHAARRNLDTP